MGHASMEPSKRITGRPTSLNPAERRVRGPWLLALLAVVSAILVTLALILARL
jgi:hypothetical protein